jgi:hypothetical protein
MLKSVFVANENTGTNKKNRQHDEVKTQMKLAKKTNILHLTQLNLDSVYPEVLSPFLKLSLLN